MARFLLLGYGSIGTKHAGILREMGHEVVTVDPDPARSAMHKHFVGLNRDCFDGVLDCTPPDVRIGWGTLMLRHFVEKPLGIPTAWLRKGSKVQVGFCYHFLPSLAQFVNIIKAKPLAHLLIVGGQSIQDWHVQDYRARRYDGVATDSLPHSLYIARWILGDCKLLGSFTGRFSDLEIQSEDTAGCLLLSEKNVPCYCAVDYLRAPRLFYIEAIANDGTRYYWEFDPLEAPEMYKAQMQAWVGLCAGNDIGVYPDLRDGIAVQKILDEVTG